MASARHIPRDEVSHPAHYTAGDVECKDALESALGREGYMDFCRGNVIKYAWRAPRKGGSVDMRKAAFYIQEWLRVSGE